MSTTSDSGAAGVGRTASALVISGFLGSGKTTLVRALLADAQRTGVKAAVVSNEFGELGIDQALLGRLGEGYIELEGGCVCCRLSDELVETLQTLRNRVQPDRIIIETSGVALPYDVQINFWRKPISDWIEEDVAVVVVNAEQLHHGRDLDATFEQQVSSADILVLNKVDLVPSDALPQLEARLREVEPEAPLVHSIDGDVDPELLFPPDPGGLRARRRRLRRRDPPADEGTGHRSRIRKGHGRRDESRSNRHPDRGQLYGRLVHAHRRHGRRSASDLDFAAAGRCHGAGEVLPRPGRGVREPPRLREPDGPR